MSSEWPPPPGFTALKAESQAGRVGCLFLLAAVLLLPGIVLLVLTFVNPAGKGDMWVMPVVGAAFTLVGGVLLYAGVKGARGAGIPRVQIFVEDGSVFRPGAVLALRLRQPGPMRIDSLRLAACCERVYQRRLKPNSSSTVEDRDQLWEQILMAVRNEWVPAGGVLERDVVFALPPDVQPTGPARPDGRIEWKLKVWGDAGVMRATYGAFDVRVEGAPPAPIELEAPAGTPSSDARPAFAQDEAIASRTEGAPDVPRPRPAPNVSPAAARIAGRLMPDISYNTGCLVVSVPFVVAGVLFLWLFFSGAAFEGRGNPYMALVGGLLFVGVGIVGTLVALANIVGSKQEGGGRRAEGRRRRAAGRGPKTGGGTES